MASLSGYLAKCQIYYLDLVIKLFLVIFFFFFSEEDREGIDVQDVEDQDDS